MQNADLACRGYKRFTGLKKGIRIRDAELGWPTGSVPHVGPYNGNNLFRDLRGKTWLKAERALRLERGLFNRLEACQTRADGDRVAIRMRAAEALLDRLDIGTISTVYAVSAAGGIPITSCNGGAFGGDHEEPLPIVGFYARKTLVPILRKCASLADVSVWTHHRGELVIGADYILKFLHFADALIGRRHEIERLRQRGHLI